MTTLATLMEINPDKAGELPARRVPPIGLS